ncbi:hypothetical protein D0T08_18275 [Emticicia sp. C21]|nr:hypothetical protein D0T08_18275 [Emticicia sp. C21]
MLFNSYFSVCFFSFSSACFSFFAKKHLPLQCNWGFALFSQKFSTINRLFSLKLATTRYRERFEPIKAKSKNMETSLLNMPQSYNAPTQD